MSEKLDKLRATLKKEQERRIKLNNRIAVLERRIQEEEAAEGSSSLRLSASRVRLFIWSLTVMPRDSRPSTS